MHRTRTSHSIQRCARYGVAVFLLLMAIAGIESPVAFIDSSERTSRLSWDDADIQVVGDIATAAALSVAPASDVVSAMQLSVARTRRSPLFEPSPRRDGPTVPRCIIRPPPAP